MKNKLLDEIKKIVQDNQKNDVYYVTGDNQNNIGFVAQELLRCDMKVILTPKNLTTMIDLPITEYYEFEQVSIYKVHASNSTNWFLGMFTSGSTGNPKLFVFSKGQINITLEWYKSIYGLTDNSLIVTSMPSTYNFSFIAGQLNAENSRCEFSYVSSENIVNYLNDVNESYDKVVVLSNPVLLDILASDVNKIDFKRNILLDSGGAPLTKQTIKWFRKVGFELHEGYGLTETCSLTHFDDEMINKSLGSVGHNLPGVKTQLMNVDDKPRIKITTPNLGQRLDSLLQPMEEQTNTYLTGDLGRITDSRLELLGRSSDNAINNFWPRDTMELIAELEPNKCILVEHLTKRNVAIRFWSSQLSSSASEIANRVSKGLHIPVQNVQITTGNNQLTHSMKIQRNK